MRITISDLSWRFGNSLPAGKEIKAVTINADGSLQCELRDKPDTRHVYRPHRKYPWFCECGYPEHETLMHRPVEKVRAPQ